MRTKDEQNAAAAVRLGTERVNQLRQELEKANRALTLDPMNDNLATNLIKTQAKLDAAQRALSLANANMQSAENQAQGNQAKAELKRINDLEKQAERDRQAALTSIDALKKDLEKMRTNATEHNRLTAKYPAGRAYINNMKFKLLWRLSDQLAQLQKDLRRLEIAADPPKIVERKLTPLQRDVMAMRYRDPNQTEVNVKLVSNDDGTGSPVYKVSK